MYQLYIYRTFNAPSTLNATGTRNYGVISILGVGITSGLKAGAATCTEVMWSDSGSVDACLGRFYKLVLGLSRVPRKLVLGSAAASWVAIFALFFLSGLLWVGSVLQLKAENAHRKAAI